MGRWEKGGKYNGKYNDDMFIEAIKNGAMLNTDIARVCGCSDSAARTHLSSLVASGKVRIQNLVHSNKKIYALAN